MNGDWQKRHSCWGNLDAPTISVDIIEDQDAELRLRISGGTACFSKSNSAVDLHRRRMRRENNTEIRP